MLYKISQDRSKSATFAEGALMANFPLFRDRTDAGEQLAQAIDAIISQSTVQLPPQIVYALPRGGLPVALPIARKLQCPLSVIVSKKISHPKNPELAIGAVTAMGNVLWNEQNPYSKHFEQQTALQQAVATAEAQMAQFSSACPQVSATGAVAIIVDDGIATGMTMAVAAQAISKQQPAAIWLCAPVAPPPLLPWLQTWGDRLVILHTPESFFSVSHFYNYFEQVKTIEAIACLHQQDDWLSKMN